MNTVTSETQLCNLALAEIGQMRITSLDEASAAAQAANRLYAPVRDHVLSLRPWGFAMKRAVLTQLETGPVYGFDHYYALPGDYLRMVDFNDVSAESARPTFLREGTYLATNEDEVFIRYVRRETDTSKFDALFVSAFATILASKLTPHITGDWGLANELLGRFAGMSLTEASTADAMTDKPNQGRHGRMSRFAMARFGGNVG